jgi:di/tricarboxylate transporter
MSKSLFEDLARQTMSLPGIATQISVWRIGVTAFALLIALTIAFLPPPAGSAPQAMVALGLIAMTVTLWATMAIPQPAAAMLFVALVLATNAAPPKAALSGFLSSSIWLVFGGLLIGTAAERTGFGRFVARRFLGGFRSTYASLVFGVLLGSTVLSFLVPSNMGRLAITVPVVMALAKDSGYALGTRGHIGLVITVVVGNFTVAQGVLPGNLLNVMIVGAGETLYGLNFSYMQYLLMCGPVLGLIKGVVVWRAVIWFYPAPPPEADSAESATDILSPDARRVSIILGCAILLWATDFLHGIKPGWISLAAGLLCLAPRVGVMPLRELFNIRRMLIIFWVSTVLSLAAVLTESGASTLISHVLTGLAGIEGRSAAYGYFTIAYLSSLMATLSTFGGAVPTMAATASEVSTATGLPLDTAVLSIAAGMSALFFPYIAAPIVVGLMMGKVSQREATRFTLILALLSCTIIIPLNALWWWLIGALG